jgi:fructose-1,6-bisphosphatase/inositol monophosphatase family enzyme
MLPFDVAAILPIIREACELGRGLQGRCRVELKPDNTFVTDADRAIETLLRERLSTLTPDWSFLGEEQGLTGDPNAPAWVIDPIDGTNNFVRDLPLWTISVGAVYNGEAICGVVAAPVLNEISWAAKGCGAWRDSAGQVQQLELRDRDALMHEDIIAYNTEVESAVDFSRAPGCMRNFGSVAYHFSLLARGALCATLARRHKLYDIAGGMAICAEVGYRAQYLDGRDWFADLTAPKEGVPLLVAPPQTMQLLNGVLALKQSPSALLGHEDDFGDEPARS